MILSSEITLHSSADTLHAHRHREAYVALVLDGRYEELSPDGAWHCEAGDLVVHPPYHVHANTFAGTTRVLNFYVPGPVSTEHELQSYAVMRPACPEDLMIAGRDIDALRETLHNATVVGASTSGDWVDLMVEDLVADSSARISDLARNYSVSPEQASRRFRQRYRMTPSSIRSERRFRRALKLLWTTSYTLSEIALMAGYADQPHFCRSCRKITGVSPGRLRRSCI